MEKKWNKNNGVQPVADDVMVEVMTANGFEIADEAGHFEWTLDVFGEHYDDVAFWRLADADSEVTK